MTPERRGAHESRKSAMGVSRDGRLLRCGLVALGRSGHASRPRTARQSRWLLSCDWHFVRPLHPVSRFSEPLMNDSVRKKGCDNQCTQETRPQDMRGSASPQGEARRKAPPRQSEASAAEGGLRAGGLDIDQTSRRQSRSLTLALTTILASSPPSPIH